MANGDIPAGWYPEPSGASGERWWDGYQWTQHVRGGAAAAEPAAHAQQASGSQVPAGWYPDPSGGGGQRYWDGGRWTEHVEPATASTSVAGSASTAEVATADPEIPAGWYPDPSGGGGQRYWDGGRWTEHVEPAAASTSVAASASTAEAATADPKIPAGWYPDPAGGSGQRWWDGTSWTDHLQDGSAGAGAGIGAAAESSPDERADEVDAAAVGDASEPTSEEQERTEHGDGTTAEADDPAGPAETEGALSRDDPLGAAPSDDPIGTPPSEDPTGTPPSDDPGERGETDDPTDRAGFEALGGAGALGAVGALGATRFDDDAEEGGTSSEGAASELGDAVPHGDDDVEGGASTHGADADSEEVAAVGSGAVEQTQPFEPATDEVEHGTTAEVDHAATDGVDHGATAEVGHAETAEVGHAATDGGADAATTAAAIPPGWYADPSRDGERWWSGESWTEHVRSANPSGPIGAEQTPSGPAERSHPAAGTSEGDDDPGGGGSSKLILVIVLIVILLAAIGAGLWFFTDVFATEGEAAAAVAQATVGPFTALKFGTGA